MLLAADSNYIKPQLIADVSDYNKPRNNITWVDLDAIWDVNLAYNSVLCLRVLVLLAESLHDCLLPAYCDQI